VRPKAPQVVPGDVNALWEFSTVCANAVSRALEAGCTSTTRR
jgi:hypothetical protein